jgi:hypothetical protein
MENYLTLEDLPQKSRKLFCSFRISCHDLEIEKGRYNNPPTPPKDRLCKLCMLEPETEEHFVIFCPSYINRRSVLLENISKHDQTIYSIADKDRFVDLMSSQNVQITKEVMLFLYGAYSDRTKLLRGESV